MLNMSFGLRWFEGGKQASRLSYVLRENFGRSWKQDQAYPEQSLNPNIMTVRNEQPIGNQQIINFMKKIQNTIQNTIPEKNKTRKGRQNEIPEKNKKRNQK